MIIANSALPASLATYNLISNARLCNNFIIQQSDNENTQTYQIKVVILICHQNLQTSLQGNV